MDLLLKLALNFAANINCKNGGCLSCKTCKSIFMGKNPNVYIIEPIGSTYVVEEIEEVIRQMSISSVNNEFKIAIMKEADLMSGVGGIAFNKMLKTLEDPPDEKCIFILLTEDIDLIIPTVKSRCQTFNWIFNSDDLNNYDEKFKNLKKETEDLLNSIILDRKNILNALNFSIKISNFIPQFCNEIEKEHKKDVEIIKKSGFDEDEINKILKKIESNYARKIKKLTNLIINYVFDIIVFYVEDIIAVIAGAKQEVLHYAQNYNIIVKNFKTEDINKYIKLLDYVKENKVYIKESINYEIALDKVILGFVQV